MKIALAQINTRVGDIAGNTSRIVSCLHRARTESVDLILFPELAIIGYPPEDLVEKKAFIQKNLDALQTVAEHSRDLSAIVGFADPNTTATGRPTFNAAALLQDGHIRAIRHKSLLPNYDVFDEMRHFEPASSNSIIEWNGRRLGISICEDVWNDKDFWTRPMYLHDPVEELARQGCDFLINISASPFSLGKADLRVRMFQNFARKYRIPSAMCNLVGGNDSLIFDGCSFLMDASGNVTAARAFEEDWVVGDFHRMQNNPWKLSEEEQVVDALRVGIRDYMSKCGFQKAIIGLSGGIDSALVAALTADAIGPENVMGVSMPSRYSSDHSIEDARQLAETLRIRFEVVPIESMFAAFLERLAPVFRDAPADVTEENLQARIRGNILMALSNKWNALVLSTGNKSELAVGYCTIYGDMCGGLAVISDVPKTMVYRVARWMNRNGEIIPTRTLTKPPSAELRANQTDQDTLPDYETLDAVLHLYIEELLEEEEIVHRGFDRGLVQRILRWVDRNEYKRRQAAPGLRITTKAFGFGRRLPIAQGWR